MLLYFSYCAYLLLFFDRGAYLGDWVGSRKGVEVEVAKISLWEAGVNGLRMVFSFHRAGISRRVITCISMRRVEYFTYLFFFREWSFFFSFFNFTTVFFILFFAFSISSQAFPITSSHAHDPQKTLLLSPFLSSYTLCYHTIISDLLLCYDKYVRPLKLPRLMNILT